MLHNFRGGPTLTSTYSYLYPPISPRSCLKDREEKTSLSPPPSPSPSPSPLRKALLFRFLSKNMVMSDSKTNTKTLKFLCSYSGKLLPRFSDGVLRYVGGLTRVLAVDRSISYAGSLFSSLIFNA